MLPLIGVVSLAFALVVLRARVQSVTIDEADSFLGYADKDWPSYWYPAAANHVLNTILERLATGPPFGLSHLSLRAPAIIGAATYMAGVLAICSVISASALLRLLTTVLLALNPFVLDYLVAARGYSLALGFFTLGLAAVVRSVLCPPTPPALRRPVSPLIIASLCAGISFCSNFSFAVACGSLVLVCACRDAYARRQTPDQPRRNWLVLLCAAAWEGSWPAVAVTIAVCGGTLLGFPKSELIQGADSLGEMWRSVSSDFFDVLNPWVVNPLLMDALSLLKGWLPAALLGTFLVQSLGWFLARRRSRVGWLQPEDGLGGARRAELSAVLGSAAALTLSLHWAAFHSLGLLLPMDRTALFWVPLLLVLFSSVAETFRTTGLVRATARRLVSLGTLAVFLLSATYVVGTLRLSYFREWKFDADCRQAFLVLQEMSRRGLLGKTHCKWLYSPSLNFYRRMYGEVSMGEFVGEQEATEGKQTYVLYFPQDQAFIEKMNLRIAYRAALSDLVIATAAGPSEPLR